MITSFTMYDLDERRELILASESAVPADLVVTNANVVVPTTREVLEKLLHHS